MTSSVNVTYANRYTVECTANNRYTVSFPAGTGPQGPAGVDLVTLYEDAETLVETNGVISNYPDAPLTPYFDGDHMCLSKPFCVVDGVWSDSDYWYDSEEWSDT